MQIAVLSSNNLELLERPLKTKLSEINVDSEFYFSGFNQYSQEIIDTKSNLHNFDPDVIIFNVDLTDLLEEYVYDSIAEEFKNRKKEYYEKYEEIKELIDKLIEDFPDSLILFNNFDFPPVNNNSLFEYNSQYGNLKIINNLNNKLTKIAEQNINFKIVDWRSVIKRWGYEKLYDRRTWYLGKIRLSKEGIEKLSRIYWRHIKSYLGRRKKCIVLDLDNTLWGGLLGMKD